MVKTDDACYEREMKTEVPPKGETKTLKVPKHPRGLLQPSLPSITPWFKGKHLSLATGNVRKLQKM